jgi:hypothetical protein
VLLFGDPFTKTTVIMEKFCGIIYENREVVKEG